ncbi:phage tail tip lysozyme [Devosia psychrophila]|uniref:Phage tail lysozyme domain-containing protein n=1 Tax=Devosia psychrophila TaxID=728005 RepID=A0A0F5Q2I0_9HYPH|nr:phage tail tip lysozyme [Devosia psychrophila]KKC34846.1 hypothetical protein WH91_01070 [Devosia psychrophila]SFC10430.1 hypothetical protein SAMN04488059_102145 [Devosia psychrophila]
MANQNTSTAYQFFLGRGYSPAQAAGVVGNLMGESAMNTRAVGDGGLAKGIAQHHPDRWAFHLQRTASQGTDPYDLMAQLDFVDWELRNKETKAWGRLQAAQTVDDATAAFIGFERPQGFTWDNPRGGHNYSGRLAFANQVAGMPGQPAQLPPLPVSLNPRLRPGDTFSPQANAPSIMGVQPSAVPYQVGGPAQSVNISSIAPTTPYTKQERYAQEDALLAQEKESQIGWIEGLGIAADQEMMLPWLLRGNFQKFVPEPGYQPDLKLLTKDIPEQYHEQFGASTSTAQSQHIRTNLMKTMEADAKLETLGTLGVALRIGAGIADPLAWAAAIGVSTASAGLGAPAALAARFGRVGMIAEQAIVGAAGSAVVEGVIMSQKPTYQVSDAAFGIGAGLIMGGAFGAFGKNPALVKEARQIEDLGRSILNGTTALTSRSRDAGAMGVAVREDIRVDTQDFVRDLDDTAAPTAFASNWRYDLSARLKGSDNPLTRALGNVLVEDGARNAKGLTPIGASEDANRLTRLAEVKWRKAFDYNFKAYSARMDVERAPGAPKPSREQLQTAYSKQVTASVRNRDPMATFDPEVAAAGAEFRVMMKQWRAMAADPGSLDGTVRKAVRGFDNEKIVDNDHYVPRVFDLGAVQAMLARHGHEPLADLIAKGMMDVNKDLAEDVAQRFGKGYVNKLHRMSAGDLSTNQRALSGEDMDELKAILGDETDLSSADLDDILGGMKPKKGKGAVTRAKARLFYNEDFGGRLKRIDGTGDDAVRISDLFLNDADALMSSYSRQMAGRVAMARVRIRNPNWVDGDEAPEFLVDGITNDSDWAKLMDQMTSVGDSVGSTNQNKIDRERLQFAYNSIIGRPTFDETGGYAQGLRMLRDYNFLRVMGQVGFAQISELANITSQVGLKATFSNMPAFKAMWRSAKNGTLDDTLAAEWEDMTSIGADWLRHSDMRRVDDYDNPLAGIRDNAVLETIDGLQQKGKRAMTVLSGMAPVNTMLQRLAGRAIFNKFAMIAQAGGDIVADKRMMGLNLDSAMLKRISGQINGKAEFNGKRLKAMNFKSWDDQGALAAFEQAVFRLGRTVVQENDIGNMAMWMSRPTAKTLLQFRSFMLAAWSKQFINGLNMWDFKTFTTFSSTMFLAGSTYVVREYLNSVGRADQKEHLAERLSMQRIAAAGLQNSSWFTILAPGIDTAWSMVAAPVATAAGMNAPSSLFDARTTQQASDAFLGNPTVGLYNAVRAVPEALINAATGNGDGNDARKIKTIFAFQNLMGITQINNLLVSGFHE